MTNSLYIPVAAVACLIFPPQEMWFRRGIAFGSFLLCLCMQYFDPAGLVVLPEHDLILLQNIGTIVVFGLICASCFHASKANNTYVEKLRTSFASESKAVNQANAAARLAMLGELSAGVAHEINNPLAVIVGRSELMKHELAKKGDRERLSNYANTILEMSARISIITKSMLGYARPTTKTDNWFNIGMATDKVMDLFKSLNQRSSFKVECDYSAGAGLAAWGDQSFFQQILLNLLTNARDAIKDAENGKISIAASTDEGRIMITVSDNGCGVPPDLTDKIMDPFYSTKAPGAGTGLGLSISVGLAASMGATLKLTSNANPTTFTLSMLLFEAEQNAACPPSHLTSCSGSGPRAGLPC
jgi:C4-dicarboxylate-specific signal transduction histidine kinase